MNPNLELLSLFVKQFGQEDILECNFGNDDEGTTIGYVLLYDGREYDWNGQEWELMTTPPAPEPKAIS